MKFFASLLFIVLFISVSINAQQVAPITDLEGHALRGKVKYTSSERFNVVDSGGVQYKIWYFTEKDSFNKEGNLLSSKNFGAKVKDNDSTTYRYDSSGNLILEENFDEYDALFKSIRSEYSGSGNILKETEKEYLKDDSGKIEDSIITIDTYLYNELNLVKEVWRSELQDKELFSIPRLYIKNIYEDSGRVRYQYEYRSASRPEQADTSYLRKNNQGKAIEQWNSQTHSLYTYNSKGKLMLSNALNIKSTQKLYTYFFEYDKWGNHSLTKTLDSNNKVVGSTIKSEHYNIDKNGNWQELKSYKDGKLVYYCKRTLNYY